MLLGFDSRWLAACAGMLVLASCGSDRASKLSLRHVVLYQNGVGYFEHTGQVPGQRLDLAFRGHEIDDVLKTITIVRPRQAVGVPATVSVRASDVPADGGASGEAGRGDEGRVGLSIMLDRPGQEVAVAYAVPAPTWKASYRLVLPEAGEQEVLLQAWASVNNTTEQDWRDVTLTLAAGEPLSFAIDLHTPEYVARPDLSGKLVEPVSTGPVRAARGQPGDGDGDGVPDRDDLCAGEPEDQDGWEDADGCPDPDNDQDRILDTDDECPSEPETYNGISDDDGCPDRGRVVVHDTNIEILDKIYFARGSAAVKPASDPIIDAIAATLQGNPDIAVVEVHGHASEDEPGAWALSGARALAVERALRARGVETRLTVEPFGPTVPIRRGDTEEAYEINRRVEFLIAERAQDTQGAAPARERVIRTADMQDSMPASARSRDVAGSVRYEIAGPVTVLRGAAALVPLLNETMEGEEVYLFRPDAGAPLSEQHPWRAGRLVNTGSLVLQPGPMAVFAGGTFVGEGLIDRLYAGETAFVPYALDRATTVRARTSSREEPVALVAIERGMATVENRLVRTTRYEVSPGGARVPARMFLRHVSVAGYSTPALPPQTQETEDGYLIPIPLTPARTSVLAVEERRPVRRSMRVTADVAATLADYLGDGVPAALRDGMGQIAVLRERLAAIEKEVEVLTDRLVEVGRRAADARASLEAVGQGGAAAALRRKLLSSLTASTSESERIGQELVARRAALVEARTRLLDAVKALSFGRPAGE